MITNSKTFCSAPWTGLNINQTGHVMPCMHSGYGLGNIKTKPIQEILEDRPLRDLKQTMARGEWHEACALCKQLEESSGASGRTVKITTDQTLQAINNDIDWFEPQHITINWSNLCNLTCVYCNPETSTAWQSVKKIPIDFVRNEQQSLIELAKSKGKFVQGLTLGGGEPLLQKGLVEFLRCLDSEKVNVLVTTNLSVDIADNPVYQELRNWPNVDWQISFDNCTKDKFEYVRNGANWDIFLANIRLMKQHGQQVAAHPAYSIYCAFDLVEYYEFCEAEDLRIFWCELNHPWDLDTRRLPLDLRNRAIAEIDAVIARWGNKTYLATDTLARYRKQLEDPSYVFNINTYVPDVLKFHTSVEQQLNKSTRFVDLWPDLAERIKMQNQSDVSPPFTPGIKQANETHLWQSPIEKESFEKMVNDPLHRDYFISKGWDKPEAITYKINSQGFRCEEFDDTPCLVALGCSFTFGVGLPVQDTWPSLVGKALGLKVVNLAWGGQGPDYCFRMAEYWLSRLNTKFCVMLTPPSSRIEVITEDSANTFLPGSLSPYYNPNDWFLNTWLMNDENHRLHSLKNTLAVRQLCADLDIPCQIYDSMKEFAKSREELEYARDYMHAGPLGHKLLAEKIINEYQTRT